ncbi:MAG: T9SS type A sorting domain-containing protein, partial [Saprospiraceae bacterium]|nr:T9SS type A sorting domain-containing protein [Saprospiraceae bacterium]
NCLSLESLFFNQSNVDSIITEGIIDTNENGSLKYGLSELTKFSYDAQCKETRQVQYFRDTTRKTERINTTYDASSRRNQAVFQVELTNGSFVDSARTNYSYEGTSKNASKITFQTRINNAWVNETENDITYTTANLPQTIIDKEWSGTAWVNVDRTTITYNAQNKAASNLSETWDNNRWLNDSRETYRYNTQGVLDSITLEEWNPLTNRWESGGGLRFQVTNNGLTIRTNFIIENDFFGILGIALDVVGRSDKRLDSLRIFYFDPQTGQGFLVSSSKYIYNTNCIKVSAQDVVYTEGVVKLTPNPASDNLTLTLSELAEPNMTATIFNSVGQAVKTLKVNDLTHQNIDVSQLSGGLYFLNLEGKKVRTTQKFVVNR